MPCDRCIDGWVEVVTVERGRYWRRCLCWMMSRAIKYAEMGIQPADARRYAMSDFLSYMP